MRKTLPASIIVLLLLAASSHADQPYGWTISASSTDAFQNTAVPTMGMRTYYLHLVCSSVPPFPDGTDRYDGMSGAEFGLSYDGITAVSLYARLPFIIVGGDFYNLQLAVGGCASNGVVADITVWDLPGTICFTTDSQGVMGVVDCEMADPTMWPFDFIGLSTTGSAPCSEGVLCSPLPVSAGGPPEVQSWSRVKAMYR